MTESPILRSELEDPGRELLVDVWGQDIWVGWAVENHKPFCVLLADPGSEVLVDDPLDRAERPVQRGERECVLEAAARREQRRDGRVRLSRLERRDGKTGRIHPGLADRLGDLGIERPGVARRSWHEAVLRRGLGQWPFMNSRIDVVTRSI